MQKPKENDGYASADYEERITSEPWDIESERKAITERTQAREQKHHLRQMWKKHRDDVYAIVEQYIREKIPNNAIEIQETKLSIQVPYLSLEIKPSEIGIQAVWKDFKDVKTRNMLDTRELDKFLRARKRSDWYKVSLSLDDDIKTDMQQHFHDADTKRDIRWSYVGLGLLLLSVGIALFLLIMAIGT